MTRRYKLLFCSTFLTAIFLFLKILALFMTNLWVKTLLAFVFSSGILIPIYWKYRFNYTKKVEKQLMISQKKCRYHYDRWYTPADTTKLEYQIEKIKKRKIPLIKR